MRESVDTARRKHMHDEHQEPQVFHLLQGDALDIHRSPTGDVGRVFRGEGVEAVWVAKQQEVIDADWFSMPSVDLLIILQGQLRVEFEQDQQASVVLEPGDLLILPLTRGAGPIAGLGIDKRPRSFSLSTQCGMRYPNQNEQEIRRALTGLEAQHQ
jgi:hypothetical protein